MHFCQNKTDSKLQSIEKLKLKRKSEKLHASEKYEISMKKLSKTGESHGNGKLTNVGGKKFKRTQGERRRFQDLGVEAATHWKRPYQSKESLDSMQSQSKLQQYLPQRRRENPEVSSQQHETLTRQRNPQENEQSSTCHNF